MAIAAADLFSALERPALRRDLGMLLAGFGGFAGLGFVLAALSIAQAAEAGGTSAFLGRLGFAGVVAGAAACAGALVGFVFGVPRRLQGGDTPAPPGADEGARGAAGYGGNTNLEQISDWLTKLLLGVGLTQLTQLPAGIGAAAAYLGPSVGEGAGPLVAALLVYWSITGFFFGYLFTRRVLPAMWSEADREGERIAEQLGRAYGGLVDRAVGAAEARAAKAPNDPAAIEDLVFNALYLPPPTGFDKAIEAGERVSVPDRSASLHAWLASAYGQKHAWSLRRGAGPDVLRRLRARVIEEVRAALAKDESWRPTLAALVEPPPGALDDDLASLREDPELRELLGVR
jgi:hypothetical protein